MPDVAPYTLQVVVATDVAEVMGEQGASNLTALSSAPAAPEDRRLCRSAAVLLRSCTV